MTAQEIKVRNEECHDLFSPTGREFSISPTVTGQEVRMREVKLIRILSARKTETGELGIHQDELLPNGGIAAKDFCGVLNLDYGPLAKKPGDLQLVLGILLRSKLILASAYPNTSKTVLDKQTLVTLPGHSYVLLNKSDDATEAWLSTNAYDWFMRDASKPNLTLGDIVLVPLN